MIYLDNAATTLVKPECVYQRVDDTQRHMAVNAGRGAYALSRRATALIDETRQLMAELVGAQSAECVVFTPSATIALNQILFGLDWDGFKTVYLSPFEHNAVARPLEIIRSRHQVELCILPLKKDCLELDQAEMTRMFSQNPPDYVFLNHVSNVVGAILPIKEITACAKQYDAVVVVDGAQSVGVIDTDMQGLNIDYLVFAGHKNLYAMFGVGGFVINSSTPLNPSLAGGNGSDSLNLNMPEQMPERYELASPNIVAIASLNESLKWLRGTGTEAIFQHKSDLMNLLQEGLGKIPSVIQYRPTLHTSVLSVNIKSYQADEVGMILDQDYDIAVRNGYHCAPYIHDLIGSKAHHGTVRLSLSYFTSEGDIEAVVKAMREIGG